MPISSTLICLGASAIAASERSGRDERRAASSGFKFSNRSKAKPLANPSREANAGEVGRFTERLLFEGGHAELKSDGPLGGRRGARSSGLVHAGSVPTKTGRDLTILLHVLFL
jgi:hypothetical protein